ncbi:hypothetical protein Spla01_03196 [Streptomyces platensis]|uniref:Uncharacterized protein n=1 Tax=Streptomyces platensis TaxID=58346 RepID=A0ABX3XQU7_STRPT|nr:hypothetical protein [Streptomyces platensis]OSY40231.1 hypothetical protein BG653_05513 [Streptomyces platensis]
MTLLAYNSPSRHASCPRPSISTPPTRIGTGRRRQSRILTQTGRRRQSRTLTDAGRRRPGKILTGAGLALLPWLGYLAGTLPPAEAAAWVTLDTLEATALLITGTRLLRGDPRHRIPAAAAALLLLTDACLDLATAAPGTELATALAMAIGAELPLAALCATLAARPTHPAAAPHSR